ncbi:DUF3997 domain-containing protein [Coraliomargarita sp. SDUM461003]|uniref:DUF3997 domain-containing protein n=1 Tax=Thalassobacterium maritimum TaxID=3041265 RepID=A0ABU1B050_9BACT|nr:DUF3997 domain-containing protein [Coraliomargarita sp. SDUM461003]MDQ8209757.1 DUF3997 domain-containing protein [Coraliomargarita sp. SDUM461003]|tara:strand:- start:599 stop:1018 length:420 start_codon:yes stop_codon:yes gene_type:complete
MKRALLIPFALLLSGFAGSSDYHLELCGGYILSRSSAHQVIVVPYGGWSKETPIIEEKVVEIAWDSRYILAKRDHLTPDQEQKTYMIPSGNYSYWILDTQTPSVAGPLTQKELKENTEKLGISELIESLKDPRTYKKKH